MTLMPPIDVSTAHHLNHHLQESFIANRTPLGRGSVVYVTFHDSVAGTTYKVIKAEPEIGEVSAKTKIHVEIPTTGGIKADEDVTFEDVGGMQKEIKLVRELVQLPLQFPQVYRQLGILPPRGIIFYGPPGSGKTLSGARRSPTRSRPVSITSTGPTWSAPCTARPKRTCARSSPKRRTTRLRLC